MSPPTQLWPVIGMALSVASSQKILQSHISQAVVGAYYTILDSIAGTLKKSAYITSKVHYNTNIIYDIDTFPIRLAHHSYILISSTHHAQYELAFIRDIPSYEPLASLVSHTDIANLQLFDNTPPEDPTKPDIWRSYRTMMSLKNVIAGIPFVGAVDMSSYFIVSSE